VVGKSEVVRFFGGLYRAGLYRYFTLYVFFAVLPFSFRAFVVLRSARFFFLVADTCDSRAVFFIFSSPFLVVRVFLAVFCLSLVRFSLLLSLRLRPPFLRALVLFLFLLCRSLFSPPSSSPSSPSSPSSSYSLFLLLFLLLPLLLLFSLFHPFLLLSLLLLLSLFLVTSPTPNPPLKPNSFSLLSIRLPYLPHRRVCHICVYSYRITLVKCSRSEGKRERDEEEEDRGKGMEVGVGKERRKRGRSGVTVVSGIVFMVSDVEIRKKGVKRIELLSICQEMRLLKCVGYRPKVWYCLLGVPS